MRDWIRERQRNYQTSIKRVLAVFLLTCLVAIQVSEASSQIEHTEDAWCDVRLYGAAGDGVTDDTAAIQAAISKAGTGGTVFFPEGIYIVGAGGSAF